MSGIELVAERPVPGHPRDYEFPETVRTTLANGLRVVVTPMPGRALIAASLVIRAGAADEPAGLGGATVLAARALTEGTEVRDAIELTEAAERLGASIHAEAGWDATFAGPRRAREPPHARAGSPRRGRCAGPRSPSARSTACATSGSPTCCRRRPIRGGAPRRRSSPRSTPRRAPTTGRPAASRRPSSG